MKENKLGCKLCEQGRPYYDCTHSRWESSPDKYLAGVKGEMTVDAGQCLNIKMELVNQKVSVNDEKQMPYPLHLNFAIKYCPLCGRKIKWLDEKLISIKDAQH